MKYIFTRCLRKPAGSVIYTTLLNSRGTIVADLIVVRQESQRYLIITSTLHGQHDLAWLRLHKPDDVTIQDCSSLWTGVALWGPKAPTILETLVETNLDRETFPAYTAREISVAGIDVLALNISFVGELGWELHCATEGGLALWDAVWQAGQPHGLVPVGSVALDSLSKEHGFLIYGHDIKITRTQLQDLTSTAESFILETLIQYCNIAKESLSNTKTG